MLCPSLTPPVTCGEAQEIEFGWVAARERQLRLDVGLPDLGRQIGVGAPIRAQGPLTDDGIGGGAPIRGQGLSLNIVYGRWRLGRQSDHNF